MPPLKTSRPPGSFRELANRGSGPPAILCVGCLGGFALLAWLALDFPPGKHLDLILLEWAGDREGGLGRIAGPIARLGDPGKVLLATLLIAFLGVLDRRPWRALGALVLVAGSGASAAWLKGVLAESRIHPELGFHQVVAEAFPSGHATATAAVALAFFLVAPPVLRTFAIVLGAGVTVAVGAALVVLVDHYPGDVLAGWLLAGAWYGAVLIVVRRLEPPQAGPESDR